MPDPIAPSRPPNRIARAYGTVAHVVLSLLVVFVVVNVALFFVPSLRSSAAVDTPLRFFGMERLLPAYPGWTAAEVARLHDESRVTFAYEPVLQFRIKPITGTYVNVTAEGVRANRRSAPWPPSSEAVNVFVFGGSTTFGWLLPDRETIPSFLQDRLDRAGCARPVNVYNLGHPSYISTQEALLFQRLLLAGARPQVALFLDGFNDFFFRGELSYTGTLTRMMEGTDLNTRLGLATRLPLYQLARRINARFYRPPVFDRAEEQQIFERVIAQWEQNRELVRTMARAHQVTPVFAWQPIPAYQYDLRQHFLYRDDPAAAEEDRPYADIGRAYALVDERRPAWEAEGDFLWLAGMQAEARENLYVDRLHYNAVASERIADAIFRHVQAAGLVPCGGATGL